VADKVARAADVLREMATDLRATATDLRATATDGREMVMETVALKNLDGQLPKNKLGS